MGQGEEMILLLDKNFTVAVSLSGKQEDQKEGGGSQACSTGLLQCVLNVRTDTDPGIQGGNRRLKPSERS